MEWNDGIGPRARRAWLLVVGPGDRVRAFAGESIPGVVAVVATAYHKDGKWSSTTYQIEAAPGVRLIPGRDGWETGTLREALKAPRWVDGANAVGVSLPAWQAFVREWRPKAAAHWDSVEESLASLDEVEAGGAEEIAISIGGPTRRQRDAGFWDWPIRVLDEDGAEVGRIAAVDGHLQATGPVRMLDVTRTSGPGGGYVTFRLGVPAGCRAVHGEAA